jgi:metallo-beta-lactamase family protein
MAETHKTGETVFDRLVNAGKRLMTVILHNKGGANKDLAKLTSQINSLCDKWDR